MMPGTPHVHVPKIVFNDVPDTPSMHGLHKNLCLANFDRVVTTMHVGYIMNLYN